MNATRKQRTAEIIRRLKKAYPDAHCALVHSSPFELLIATILSAQCTDARVNMVTANLFRKYRGPQDFIDVSQAELEKDIHSTGFFRNKAKNVKAASRRIVEVYGGNIPQTMDEILTLGGVARKTANVVLGNAFGSLRRRCRYPRFAAFPATRADRRKKHRKDRRDLEQLVPKKTG